MPPLRIPYLCQDVEPYDGQGLFDFPLRVGWITSPSELLAHGTARRQSWLYFGLLVELFGQSVDTNEFISTSLDGRQYVTTCKLPALLEKECKENSRLYTRMTALGFIDPSEKGYLRGRPRVRLNKRIANALKLVEEQSDALDSVDSLACVIALSIKILIWSISNALATYIPSHKERAQDAPRSSRILKMRMLQSGKCPYWTEIYNRTYSLAMIYYLASSPSIDGRTNHGSCSEERCVAHDVVPGLYTSKHADEDCQCDMIGPDIGKVTDIVDNDGVPLMRFKETPSGDLALDVVQAQYGVHYTAISHVWSGGLGNENSNSLPQCQLKNICKGKLNSGTSLEDHSSSIRLKERSGGDGTKHHK